MRSRPSVAATSCFPGGSVLAESEGEATRGNGALTASSWAATLFTVLLGALLLFPNSAFAGPREEAPAEPTLATAILSEAPSPVDARSPEDVRRQANLAAQVAARVVGMCGERAESTKAPPIIYPGATATASSCAKSEASVQAEREGLPTELSSKHPTKSQEVAILAPSDSATARSSVRVPLPLAGRIGGREPCHRLPRPPRAS